MEKKNTKNMKWWNKVNKKITYAIGHEIAGFLSVF
jgi:hypothetical protein